jgi:DNA-binding transcriptional regulator GbsR (MarR family)
LSDLSAEQQAFIDDMTVLLTPWGMPPTQAHLYAYLLLVAEPLDLDTIAAQLGMAKSSAFVAARTLESFHLIRRYTERGSKRVRYGASDRFSGYILAQAALMGDISRLIESRAAAVAEPSSLLRLRYFAAFNRKMEATLVDRVRELMEEFNQFGPDEELR